MQRVLQRHDDIAKGVPPNIPVPVAGNVNQGSAPPRSAGVSFAPLLNVHHEDDEPEDEFSVLSRRQAICFPLYFYHHLSMHDGVPCFG